MKVPSATYRLQLHSAFTFDDAAAILDYLRDLGVSHVYCSPYLQAAAGSTHGYDVIDHKRVNDELGGEDAHAQFVDELRTAGLGQILDIVPNHMAIGERTNRWWWDVLENGPSSRYASFFDVDWDPPEARLHNLTLLPVLGDHYGRVLESGELKLEREGGRFVIRYHDHVFPVAPRSLPDLLTRAATLCGSDELAFAADVLRTLPGADSTDAISIRRRHRDKEIVASQIAELCSGDPRIAEAIDRVLHELNHDYEALDQVLSNQNFRLAWWRTAGRELGYRRFFDINSLAGLRAEDDQVMEATHCRVFEWLRDGTLDGVRVDHPDGLRDPQEYFEKLRKRFPSAWILAEKILEVGETLRESWPISGTTGYEFLHRVDGLFVDPRGEPSLTETYSRFTGEQKRYHDLVHDRKHQVLRGNLGSDVNRLTAQFMDVCERHRRFRDFTRHEIHQALREVIACFPVYRTYVRAEVQQIEPDDRKYITQAISCAREYRPDMSPDLFEFIGSVLMMDRTGAVESEFVMRFQQFTGPAMAKGVEDTAFYVYNRLTSLNEVGGDPGQFGVSPDEFHQLMAETAESWPAGMLTTSTHDTKRSEDVRCRLHLLSEIPDQWAEAVSRWAARGERYGSPDRNTEYLLYQTLVGAWPISCDRLLKYMEKASREGKTHTSWTDPKPEWEESLRQFVTSVCNDSELMAMIGEFASGLIPHGRLTSLSQTLIKLTAPGVPDLYQGTEIEDLSLVDPDNRRPVDYDRRRAMLAELRGMSAAEALTRADDGFAKLWVTWRVLQARQTHAACFRPGRSYQPLAAAGAKAHHVVAFIRGGGAITVAPRLVIGLGGDWQDTVLPVPDGRWYNVITSEKVQAGELPLKTLLQNFPVALLVRD